MKTTIGDKLAQALAYRLYCFSVYCQEHEYTQADIDCGKARNAWLECKRLSEGLSALSTKDLKEALEQISIGV